MKRLLLIAFSLSFFAACGATSVGLECTSNDQCDNGQTCYTAAPGGYCTKGCIEVGGDSECPGGSICTETSFGRVCAKTCQSKGDCREEYECNGVSRTETKACALK